MASIEPTKQWGLTPPISTSKPEPIDLEKNADMIEELKRENNYESQDETNKRMHTLKLLQRVSVEFVKEVSRRQRLPPSQIEQFGAKVFPYGSYRLGVFGPGSDIDTLAVAPRHVKRDDFFAHFPDILRKIAGAGAVTSLTAVPDSFVPIIKLVLNNIEIDLIFVAIESLQTIPKDLKLDDNKLLDGLDQAGIRAITGPRVTDDILALVPEHKTFRHALRTIKLWAQRRAIYANIVGYPGGVAWAMLVARVCQLYPYAVGATLVNKFFLVMREWKWPTPVMLKNIETGKEKTWNPQVYPGDKKNIMPIITPAYPSMCATYNISKSGKTIITRELVRGSHITNDIFEGRKNWSDLFKKHTFFTQDHKYYLSVIASAQDPDAAKAWSGLVESKIRILVMSLEGQADMIELARPFTKGFKRVHSVSNDEDLTAIRNGSMKFQVEEMKQVETTDPELVTANGDGAAIPAPVPAADNGQSGARRVHTYTFYVAMDLTPRATKNLDISHAIKFFRDACRMWPKYDDQIHDLNVKPLRSYELPDDLFDKSAGEVKPTKQSKKTAKVVKQPMKRSFPDVDDTAAATNGTTKRQELMASKPTATAAPA